MTAATSALTVGLVLRGVTDQPYAQTRAATAGPDVVATEFPGSSGPPADRTGLAAVAPVARASGVVARSGPYPVAFPVLRANGHTDAVLAHAPGVTAHSGPYPVAWPVLRAHGRTADVMAEGRDGRPGRGPGLLAGVLLRRLQRPARPAALLRHRPGIRRDLER
jgi:putative ABC transport system permease protein